MSNQDQLAELKARLMAVIDSYKQFSKELPAELKAAVNQTLGAKDSTTPPAANNNQAAPQQVTASKTLSASVGDKGQNKPEDVLLVKTLLNNFYKSFNLADTNTNTKVGPTTIGVIKKFQQEKVGFANPDGLIEVGGKSWKVLSGANPPVATNSTNTGESETTTDSGQDFSHPEASKVKLGYSNGGSAHPLNDRASKLLRSILASCGIFSATVTSTKRTFADQARIMLTYYPTYGEMAGLYGAETANAAFRQGKSRAQFAEWLKERYLKTGRGSRHIKGYAIDVVPGSNRAAYAAKLQSLKGKGSGVSHVIPLGVDGEKVDHVEFSFEVTNIKGIQ